MDIGTTSLKAALITAKGEVVAFIDDDAYPDARWTRTERGVFECDADWYAKSGGILEPMPRYEKMYGRPPA